MARPLRGRSVVGVPDHPRLSALDGTFLELEDADPCAQMHLGAILILGPRADGSVPTLAEVRAHVGGRLQGLPRFRQRLAGTGPGLLRWQHWIDDVHFDVARHVLPGTLPAPGDWEALFAWAGDYYSARLERTLPLWQVMVIDGLADGHWALITKTHHCMVDGLGAIEAAQLLFDGPEPTGDRASSEADAGAGGAFGSLAPVLGGLAPVLGGLAPALGGVRAGLRAAAHPRDLARRAAALGELAVREELIGAPDLSINVPLGPRRRLAAIAVDLAEARDVHHVLGGSLNDVVLAGVCAGLRGLLIARAEDLPARGVRAMVPMDVRRRDDGTGNHVSSLFVDLPVAEPDAGVRYDAICVETRRIKRSDLALGADTLLQLGEYAPPIAHRIAARRLSGHRLFNLTITNVPGPPLPVTALGAPLKRVWPLVPLASSHSLGVAVFSYAGQLMFGIVADHDTTPDLDTFAAAVEAGLQDLRRRAAALSATPIPSG